MKGTIAETCKLAKKWTVVENPEIGHDYLCWFQDDDWNWAW
jgi:hypothetical protein